MDRNDFPLQETDEETAAAILRCHLPFPQETWAKVSHHGRELVTRCQFSTNPTWSTQFHPCFQPSLFLLSFCSIPASLYFHAHFHCLPFILLVVSHFHFSDCWLFHTFMFQIVSHFHFPDCFTLSLSRLFHTFTFQIVGCEPEPASLCHLLPLLSLGGQCQRLPHTIVIKVICLVADVFDHPMTNTKTIMLI